MDWTVSTMVLIASMTISWLLRTVVRNSFCSSCWVLVLVLGIVFASLSASAANFTKQCLVCQAEVLALVCAGVPWGAAGGGRLGRGPGRRGGLGGPGLFRRGLRRGLGGGRLG